MIEIRFATLEDIEDIHRVSSHLGYAASSLETSRLRLEEILTSPTDLVWVWCEGDTIKGWLHLFVAKRLASPAFAEIGGLVVDPASRRSGLGRGLVNTAAEWSRQNALNLRVRCNAKRTEANQFYAALGFKLGKIQNIHELTS